MTYAVDRINGVRTALDDRAGKLGTDALAKRLRDASMKVDDIRRKIVATKEGGMITGEERLREYLSNLYGDVTFYEGRPSATQVARADALAKELSDVVAEFDAWSAKELAGINSALEKKKLAKIEPLTRSQWESASAGGSPETAATRYIRFRRVSTN
jgi:hypothetical protein